ncbi:hypothetical protein BRW64_02485 [Mycolicibacterium diernhoferi]|uniref:Uncharacterized protein n=1 Tax=Mycolicibacterium diernhoferi TaxID=1801 RepID=A0A1Q4HLY6_9MYCO|nr:hypothetical protein BRW64_02485 [Mycolicibacterium diernhoferi]OPE55545.1 hypothetical protein BV510_04445 [Mycolicibacterium diernhoferi]PEG52095.1 hypothetical protein CRI78_23445 [Mycolicibacterium diernhoferi]
MLGAIEIAIMSPIRSTFPRTKLRPFSFPTTTLTSISGEFGEGVLVGPPIYGLTHELFESCIGV